MDIDTDRNYDNNSALLHKSDLTGQINFKSIKFFSDGFFLLLIFVGAAFVGALFAAINMDNDSRIMPLLLIALAAFCGVLIGRYYTWRKWAASIQFRLDSVSVPRRQNSKKLDALPFHALKSIDIRGKGKRQILVIGTLKKTYMFALKTMEGSREEVEAIIKSAILRSEGGEQLWEMLDVKQENAKALMAVKPMATIVLSLGIALVYLGASYLGGANLLNLLSLGANSALLVNDGQWSRLFTGNFLHAGFLHIYFNLLGLFIFGSILEKLLGWQKLLIVFLAACLGGALLSHFFALALIAVGASGGIFGLLGGLLYINWKKGASLPAGFNLGWRVWALLLGLNGALPFFVPQIDWAAHLGGFITGAVVTWWLLHNELNEHLGLKEQLEQWRANSRRVLNIVLVIAFVYGFAVVERISQFDERQQDLSIIFESLKDSSDMVPVLANELAWSIVLDKNRSAEAMEIADDLMVPVISRIEREANEFSDENKAAFLDTYASIKYLQGSYHEAAAAEHQALIYHYKNSFASQFSRFIAARNAEQGPWVRGDAQISEFSVEAINNTVLLKRTPMRIESASVIIHALLGQQRKGYFICFLVNSGQITMSNNSTVFGEAVRDLSFVIEVVDTQWVNQSRQDECQSASVDGLDVIQAGDFLSRFL